jgi:hypothetical protein
MKMDLETKLEECKLCNDKVDNKLKQYGFHIECEKYKPISAYNRACRYELKKESGKHE